MTDIRRMTIDDYDGIYAVWKACKGMGLNNLDDSYEGIQKFIDHNPTTCLIAVEDDHIVGGILVGTDGRRGYIYHTAVHPDAQRKGIGHLLVQEALKEVEALGIHKTALVVFQRNEEGNAFWQAEGFGLRTDINYRDHIIHEMIRYDS